MEDVAKRALKNVTLKTLIVKSMTKGHLRNHCSKERQDIWIVKTQIINIGLVHFLPELVELSCMLHGVFFRCQTKYHLTVGASQGNETGFKHKSLIIQQNSRVHFGYAEKEGLADNLTQVDEVIKTGPMCLLCRIGSLHDIQDSLMTVMIDDARSINL